MSAETATTLHANCVALGGRAVLILGASGSGKSALALQLMALGGTLVADDRTELTATPAGLLARAPSAIRGRIEARGIGILNAAAVSDVPVVLAVDLDKRGDDRLPPRRSRSILGHRVNLIHGQDGAHFPAAIRQYVMAGRSE